MGTSSTRIEQGVFIPLRFLPPAEEYLIVLRENEVILRPRMDKETAFRVMRELREELRKEYGEFPDSSELIRQDRDER